MISEKRKKTAGKSKASFRDALRWISSKYSCQNLYYAVILLVNYVSEKGRNRGYEPY